MYVVCMYERELRAVESFVNGSYRIIVRVSTEDDGYETTLVFDSIEISFTIPYVVIEDEGRLHEAGDVVNGEYELEEVYLDDESLIVYARDEYKEPEVVDARM